MVLVYAGRRAKSLPAGSEPVLVRRVQRLLAGLVPSSVIGAAADGGDLLVLETALEGRARPHVVLPTIRDVFEHASVDIACAIATGARSIGRRQRAASKASSSLTVRTPTDQRTNGCSSGRRSSR